MARTLDIVSDAWAFLIIREAFFGTRTFEAFAPRSAFPRATLDGPTEEADAARDFSPGRDRRSSQRNEYRLTKMGFDLYPSFIALMQFGDRWLPAAKPPPLTLVHVPCGCDSHPDRRVLALPEERHRARGPIPRWPRRRPPPAKAGRNTRRASDGSRFLTGRPSSVSSALQIIGDKWSFMVVREAFFGNRRYDKIQTELEIAPEHPDRPAVAAGDARRV